MCNGITFIEIPTQRVGQNAQANVSSRVGTDRLCKLGVMRTLYLSFSHGFVGCNLDRTKRLAYQICSKSCIPAP
jgi:hypothetical protein